MDTVDIINVSKEEIDDMICHLAEKIKKSNKRFDEIVGIANGGLYISKPLSEKLDIPHSEVRISFYQDGMEKNSDAIIEQRTFIIDNNKKYLLVDDLIDSGATLNCFKDYFKMVQNFNFEMACLYWYPEGIFGGMPDYYIKEKYAWIVFPWERDEND